MIGHVSLPARYRILISLIHLSVRQPWLSLMVWDSSTLLSVAGAHSSLITETIPRHEPTVACLSVHQLTDVWVVSRLGLFRLELV